MARRSDDPMSGLLSSVGGIDSALFQRPQSLKDMKVQQPGTRPPLAVGPTRTAPEQSKPTYVSPPTASRPGPAAAKPREQPSSLTGSADIEFGDIRALGGASTKQSRYMRLCCWYPEGACSSMWRAGGDDCETDSLHLQAYEGCCAQCAVESGGRSKPAARREQRCELLQPACSRFFSVLSEQ